MRVWDWFVFRGVGVPCRLTRGGDYGMVRRDRLTGIRHPEECISFQTRGTESPGLFALEQVVRTSRRHGTGVIPKKKMLGEVTTRGDL